MANVLFIQNDYFHWLGQMYISAVLKLHGHRVRVARAFCDKQVALAVRRHQPDLVAMYAYTGGHHFRLQAAAAAKAALPGVKVILGGHHPTYFPEVVKEPGIDFICRGEGEYPMLDLCNRLDASRPVDDIPNIWTKVDGQVVENDFRPLIEDLDELPFPDRELYLAGETRPQHMAFFVAGRGCPYSCGFCYNEQGMALHRGKGPWVRFRSPENVIAEVEEVRRHYCISAVRFEDDTFTLKRDWSLAFLDLYQRRVGLPFFVNTRADALDREMTERLKSAGCYMVTFGIETASERMRNEVLSKNVSDATIRRAAETLHAVGLPFQASNILGLPGETLEEGIATIKFNIELGVKNPLFNIFQPFPYTCVGEIAKREWGLGGLDPDKLPSGGFSGGGFTGSIAQHIPEVRRLSNLHKFAFITVKYPFVLPLVRQLIKMPPNPAFVAVHRLGHLFAYSNGAHMSPVQGALVGLKVTFGPRLSRFLANFRPQ